MKRGALATCLLGVAGAGALFLLRPTPVTVADVVTRDIAPEIQGVGTVAARP